MQKINERQLSILVMNDEINGWRHVFEWTHDDAGQVTGATLEKIVDGVARRGDVWIPVADIRNSAFSS